MAQQIRVAIIDDSLMFRTFLQQSLAPCPDIHVAGVFSNPLEAIAHISEIHPDVLAVDMEMPHMRGSEFLRKVLPENPELKAIVISSLSGNVFDAMQAGAIDFVGKPGSRPGYSNAEFVSDVIEVIKIAAAAKAPTATRPESAAIRRPALTQPSGRFVNSRALVAIGASTGGTEAIAQIIQYFPSDMPGVVIVQHMPAGFTRMYAERMDKICAMTVKEAQNKDRVERGLILIAPGGTEQMRVTASGSGYAIDLRPGPKVSGHCPSVDVLFESVAAAAGKNAVGVLLTGMGADGAQNLKKMRDAGAHTIGQDKGSCIVYGMPKVAYDIGGVAEQLPLRSISSAVTRCLNR